MIERRVVSSSFSARACGRACVQLVGQLCDGSPSRRAPLPPLASAEVSPPPPPHARGKPWLGGHMRPVMLTNSAD